MTTVGEICWSHLQWASVTPFVTLGKSVKSKCGVSPVCVFNVPLLLSPMTRGGLPRVLALSPGVLSLLYLSTRHGCSPKDSHTCMLKKGSFFSSQHPQRKSDVLNCSPTAVVLFMATFFFYNHPYLHQARWFFLKQVFICSKPLKGNSKNLAKPL